MRYFRTDDNKLLTMYDVVKTYLELKSNGNLADYEDFKTYLGACMYYNNGTLTEISKEDAKDSLLTRSWLFRSNSDSRLFAK